MTKQELQNFYLYSHKVDKKAKEIDNTISWWTKTNYKTKTINIFKQNYKWNVNGVMLPDEDTLQKTQINFKNIDAEKLEIFILNFIRGKND